MKRLFALSCLSLLFAIFLGAAGCGGDGDGGPAGPSSDAPVVSDFTINPLTPEKAYTNIQYLFTATVTDPNGDLMGGRVEACIGNCSSLAIDSTVLQGTLMAVGIISNPIPPGPYGGTFQVFDAAGNGSAVITFTLNVRQSVAGGQPFPAADTPGAVLHSVIAPR